MGTGSSDSHRRRAIIGGTVGGAGLLLILLVLFLLIRSKKTKRKERGIHLKVIESFHFHSFVHHIDEAGLIDIGDILGATELRGPVNFRYKDLKAATKNFSKENKLGEGGFGDVYKVID